MNYKKETESLMCPLCERKEDTTEHVMSYSRKNSNRGVENMEFSGVLKKKRENSRGQLKEKWKFQGCV